MSELVAMERYSPPQITQCSQWVAQTPGEQEEDHHGIGKLRHGHTSVDQDQGEEPQCPHQKASAPLISERPMPVTGGKARQSHNQDIAWK